MCSDRSRIVCDNRCPNAPEPKPIKICSECKRGIYAGDEYYEGIFGPVCKDCMEDKDLNEILDIFGEKMMVAEVGQWS